MQPNGVSLYGIEQDRDSISLWRVILGLGMDRDAYIKQCYMTGTVTIANMNGEVYNKIKIGKLNLQLVDFPKDKDSFGSEVVCVKLPYSAELRVVDVYYTESQYQNQNENQFISQKSRNGSYSGQIIDGEGNITLSVFSDSKTGTITITAIGKGKSGVVNISADGQIQVISPKINLNKDGEPMLLGTHTTDFLSDLLDQLGKESAGPYPLLGQQTYIQMKEKLDALKSKKSTVA
jgi:hypothetical protein